MTITDTSMPVISGTTLGDQSKSTGLSIFAFLQTIVPLLENMAQEAFRPRRASMARWATILEPVNQQIIPGDPLGLPPLPLAEDQPAKEMDVEDGALLPRAGIYGATWSPSIQNLSRMTRTGVERALFAFGNYLADGVEYSLASALDGSTFQSAQRVASAFTAASLNSAMTKYLVLTDARGGYAPPAAVLLMAPDCAVTFASIFPYGVPGLTVSVSRFIGSGRFYLMPAADRSPLTLSCVDGLAVDVPGFSAGADARFRMRFWVSASVAPSIRLAADSSPRFTIYGGA